MQESLMIFSPDTGDSKPYPSHAKQWRKYHGQVAWLVNPWSGHKRDARDIGSDTFGHLINADGILIGDLPTAVAECGTK